MSLDSSFSTISTASLSTQAAPNFRNNGQNKNKNRKIFLGVAPATTELQLFAIAQEYGSVRDVRIPKDQEGRSRCFAFITFQWHEDAEMAMNELNGSALDGLILCPRWAEPKKGQNNNNSNNNGSHRYKSKKNFNNQRKKKTSNKKVTV